MTCENKIREIIAANVKTTEPIDTYDANKYLQNIGMDSLAFIRVVIAIEDVFDMEFPSDKLIVAESGTISQLCKVVDSVISKK